MQVFRTKEFWVIRKLGHFERSLLLNIPEAANAEGHRGAMDRLFPSPLAEEEQFEEEHDEFLQDWQEFVASTLRDEFAAAVDTVKTDLDNMQRDEDEPGFRLPDEEGGDMVEAEPDEDFLPELGQEEGEEEEATDDSQPWYLVLPLTNGEHWFSALNQARLVMAQRYELYDEDGRIQMPVNLLTEKDQQTYKVIIQNELYSIIQEFLVEQVMSA